jgi:hypothetical protein
VGLFRHRGTTRERRERSALPRTKGKVLTRAFVVLVAVSKVAPAFLATQEGRRLMQIASGIGNHSI